jgi:[ribosomal protein S5]-alanine N-acetyltransferase
MLSTTAITVNFQPFPTLETEGLVLRNVEERDAEAMFALRSDNRIMQYLNRPKAQTIDDAVTLIHSIRTNLQNNTGITWAITQKGNDTLLGTIGFWRIEAQNFRAEIGYLLHTAYQGRGWMSAVIQKVIAYGFEQMQLHSIEAHIDPRNTPSARLLEKANFIREAYFKENLYQDGVFTDTAVYSLLNPAH